MILDPLLAFLTAMTLGVAGCIYVVHMAKLERQGRLRRRTVRLPDPKRPV